MIARHYQSGAWVKVTLDGAAIASVEPADGPAEPRPDDEWIAPALWDIQTNGRWGVSFSSPDLTAEQVAEIVLAQKALGTARLCPTLITASRAATVHGLRTIAAACERWPEVDAMVLGVHLEGPSISEVDGYRGAHPREHVRDPDWGEFQEWHEASGGRIAIVTLAPERPGAIEFIRALVGRGIVVALGHTAADGATIRAAADAGARLSTHLGNGIAAQLSRHPNPIWHQAAEDRLFASFIADGHHLDADTLRVLARAKGAERTILVSDASPLAGLPVGTYGEWAVDPSGKVVVAGTPYLAGSNQGIDVGIGNLVRWAGVPLGGAIDAATQNPARLLGRPQPNLEAGSTADLLRFRWSMGSGEIRLLAACVGGTWTSTDGASGAVGGR